MQNGLIERTGKDGREGPAQVDVSPAEKIPSPEELVRALHPLRGPHPERVTRLPLNGAAQKITGERRKDDADFSKAANLLDRAWTRISHLTARRDELEQAAVAREEFFAERIRHLQEQVTEWERRAKVMITQLQECETKLSEQQLRIEALTQRAESAEGRALITEQQASDTRDKLQMYHDKIIDTLGALG